MNVLIVDDQASQRAILRHLVQDIDANIRVTDFADPVQALLWSQQEPPDMVILDYRMPKMDGLEFARRFRRLPLHRDIPIILVTVVGDVKASEAMLCQQNGVSAITEIQVGIDGISLATAKNTQLQNLSTRDIYMALAKTPFGKPNRARRSR